MKKLPLLMFAITVVLAGTCLADELSPERQSAIRNILNHDCGACHGLTLKGGLGPALLPEALAGKPDDLLVSTILNGRPGTAMPPWQPFMNRDEAAWLVGILRNPEKHNPSEPDK